MLAIPRAYPFPIQLQCRVVRRKKETLNQLIEYKELREERKIDGEENACQHFYKFRFI